MIKIHFVHPLNSQRITENLLKVLKCLKNLKVISREVFKKWQQMEGGHGQHAVLSTVDDDALKQSVIQKGEGMCRAPKRQLHRWGHLENPGTVMAGQVKPASQRNGYSDLFSDALH